jgi:hypothetical protein
MTDGKASAALPAPSQPPETEAMRKLRALKEKITNELHQEQKQRLEFEQRDVIVPLSLAGDYAATANKRGAKAPASNKQQVEKLVHLTKEKIGGLKQLDKQTQRDLETELEKKAGETIQLKAHNQRLREILTLRQDCNSRREEDFEKEVRRVKSLTDEMCVEAITHGDTMRKLHEMNQQVQDGAVLMKDHIEEQAEAERLALIRTYRVRMREVKQQLKVQEAANLEGASAWIKRYNMLDEDRRTAEENLKALQQKIELLATDNRELKVMRKHQDEQRNALAQKIAVLKRENRRFEEHIERLQAQSMMMSANPGDSANHSPHASNPSAPPGRNLSSRNGSQRLKIPSLELRQQQALDTARKMLDEMRNSVRKVRSAHVELLQERTELEMFLRQCIEDVRRDMYRFTVVSNISRTMNGNHWEEKPLLEDYGIKERKRLLDILNSKLQVLTTLLEKMFPGRLLHGEQALGDFLKLEASPQRGSSDDGSERAYQTVPLAHTMDDLWNQWKSWTRSVTPH